MNIGIVVFDHFTDLDFYLPWDILNRVRLMNLAEKWKVDILCDSKICTSVAGLELKTTKPYNFANSCDAVLFCSGSQTRDLIRSSAFLETFKLNPDKQAIAAIDSGALILAALGLLKDRKATTYPTASKILEELGAKSINAPFVEDQVATAARCLSGDKLALWIIEKLCGPRVATQVYESIAPLSK